MISSVRLRLALWHTLTLAVLLCAFAAAGYAYLARSTLARTDALLAEAARAFVGELRAESGDEGPGAGVAQETARDFRLGDTRILVLDAAGHLLAASPADPRRPGPDPRRIAARAGRPEESSRYFTVPRAGGGLRVYMEPIRLGRTPLSVVAYESLHGREDSLEGVRTALTLAVPVALLLAGLGGYLLARRSLAPVLTMSESAERIGAGTLHERLPVANPHDELGRLATVLNHLLGRLGGALEQQRRFMADAAHELRTPVAILRSEAEVALSRTDRSPEALREALAVAAGESRRLSRIVDDLFLLARTDAGEQALRPGELYLNDLVEEAVRGMQALAAARGIDLVVETNGDAPFRGDEEHLRRLVMNLLDNALKYAPRGSRVSVTLWHEGGRYGVTVTDEGTPVPPELRERIFERFYRAESARVAEGSGAGLGLAIARWVAEAHGGTLALAPGGKRGNVFVVSLPAPPLPE